MANFENILPSQDTVYHLTSGDNMEAILEHGLTPAPVSEHHNMRRWVNEVVDSLRPPLIVEAGIARGSAVYAHPSLEAVNQEFAGASRFREVVSNPVAIGVNVDPDSALVVDGEKLKRISRILYLERKQGHSQEDRPKQVQARLHRLAENYWNSAVTLGEYREHYREDSLIEVASDPTAKSRPAKFGIPEVMLQGPVPASRLTWAASILVKNATGQGFVVPRERIITSTALQPAQSNQAPTGSIRQAPAGNEATIDEAKQGINLAREKGGLAIAALERSFELLEESQGILVNHTEGTVQSDAPELLAMYERIMNDIRDIRQTVQQFDGTAETIIRRL